MPIRPASAAVFWGSNAPRQHVLPHAHLREDEKTLPVMEIGFDVTASCATLTLGNICPFFFKVALTLLAAGALFPVDGMPRRPSSRQALCSVFALGNALQLKGFRPPMSPRSMVVSVIAPELSPSA